MPSATQRRNGAAPASAPAQQTAEQVLAAEQALAAPALDIAAAVESADIAKRVSVFVDVPGCPRVPTDAGTLAVVQREKRADGSLGEYLYAEIRPPKTKGEPESATRVSIGAVQRMKSALDSAGVPTLR